MKRHASRWVGILCMLLSPLTAVPAADGRLEWVTTAEGPGVRVRGDGDDDWLLQESADLATWTSLGQGPVLGGRSNPPIRLLGSATGPTRFVRAVKTGGLFDDTLVRTITLTFGQANWQSLLTTSRSTGSNTVGALALDNGAAIPGIGARYKGNTSFSGMGSVPTKKSVNLTIDQSDPTADIMGYETLNLNNAYGDETILREPVYFNVMRRYTVCPRASLARLVINGTYWGLYSFVQQEDGDLIDEWFPSNDGDRWRAPNIGGGAGAGGGPPGGGPGGGGGFSSGGSALSFLGTNVSSYAANYELKKSSDSTNAWRRLVNVINVLNNTPSATFRDKVEEVLAVDR
ncbi:MAG: CotH kinase family protein, partial [Verrucomicrobiales bacterium]|nr:CotH kinase family protein [Verrucomicrobiales bacterium]